MGQLAITHSRRGKRISLLSSTFSLLWHPVAHCCTLLSSVQKQWQKNYNSYSNINNNNKNNNNNNNLDSQQSYCCGIQWPAFLKTAALGWTRFTHSCSSCNPHPHPRHIPPCSSSSPSSSSSSSSSSPSSSSWCETKLFVFLTWAVTRCCQASGNSHYLKTRRRQCWFYSSMLLPSKLQLLLPRLYYLKHFSIVF